MPTEIEELLVSVAEHQRSRHYGKYRGLVREIDNDLCRIKATVPAIYDEEDSPWALPCLPFAGPQHGLVLLPEVGDGVWIEFEAGDISRPVWTGCWFADGQRPEPKGEKARLLATSGGHQILIDEDGDTITLEHPGGAKITLGSAGITLEMSPCKLEITTSEIKLNDGMVKVTTAGASLVNDAFKVGG